MIKNSYNLLKGRKASNKKQAKYLYRKVTKEDIQIDNKQIKRFSTLLDIKEMWL